MTRDYFCFTDDKSSLKSICHFVSLDKNKSLTHIFVFFFAWFSITAKMVDTHTLIKLLFLFNKSLETIMERDYFLLKSTFIYFIEIILKIRLLAVCFLCKNVDVALYVYFSIWEMFKPFTLCRRRIQNAMNIFISAMFCREKIIIVLEHENKMPKEQSAGQESDEVRFCKHPHVWCCGRNTRTRFIWIDLIW